MKCALWECDNEFTAKNPAQKYCSDKCKWRQWYLNRRRKKLWEAKKYRWEHWQKNKRESAEEKSAVEK